MDYSKLQDSSSRSVSPEAQDHQNSSPISPLPPPVKEFFKSVSPEGFPLSSSTKPKAQPWKVHWTGPQEAREDGKLIVACPKKCTYGSNNLGGY